MPDIEFKPKDDDAILREVFDTKNIETKTELNDQQIQSVNKLKTLSVLFNSDLLKDHLKDFMEMQKSRNRKSMEEFVDGIKSKKRDEVDKGFLGNMFG